jgi:CheY-like chemotaxis protein
MILERKIRILAAEADPSFVKMIEDSLKESGSLYDLEEASSGRDCLEKLREQKFDILLSDKNPGPFPSS